ncbi:MAG: hypothetical protein RLZZ490_1726 [Cyanobacteriota bacterium]|jgi:hypothetical protein
MKIRWRKLLLGTAIWLSLEVILTVLGLDDLADSSEYIFNRHSLKLLVSSQTLLIALS